MNEDDVKTQCMDFHIPLFDGESHDIEGKGVFSSRV
jgi:hypothetical protein